MVCRSVPTENRPTRSHESKPKERRPLVKIDTTPDDEESSTSTSFPSEFSLVGFDSIVAQAQEGKFDPWKAEILGKEKVKFDFFDKLHCLPKFSLKVDNSFKISVLVYNWLLLKNHVYQECIQTVRYANFSEVLEAVEKSSLCNGFPQDIDDDVKPVVVDPTSQCFPGQELFFVMVMLTSRLLCFSFS